jgi:uncharacterized protein YeeX (DUF496 family)
MVKGMKKVYRPRTRLSLLACQDGGISRQMGVAEAQKAIDTMREESEEVICDAIAALEAISRQPRRGATLTKSEIGEIMHLADQVVTIAGTFGYDSLGRAARSLCDVVDGLSNTDASNIAPINVHIQALRLMAPGSAKLSPSAEHRVLSELEKIIAHFGFVSMSDKYPIVVGNVN